jgi:quinone-modifying oxidoreductase, subunit QmoA
MTAAVEAAEAGCQVILIEKSAALGGRALRANLYFPKLCPPSCGLEINLRRLRNNSRITVLTLTELESLTGAPGNYEATIRTRPRYVTSACTQCGDCAKVCPAEVADEFNFGLVPTKAVHIPHHMAFPPYYVVERAACKPGCDACAASCSYGAIDLHEQPEKTTFRVSAVVAATGWAEYDAAKITDLGFGRLPNVVTNVLLERMAAPDGPNHGKILRPSDGKAPRRVAFVQCAGSRDENHLPYCSSVCCSVSLKQTTYLRKLYPESEITIYYIDLRTPGLLQDFAAQVVADPRLHLVKGKVGKIETDSESGGLLVTAEEILSGQKVTERFDLVVLATGMVPQTSGLPQGFSVDEFGFIQNNTPGLYGAGCVKRPEEVSACVRDATGVALKALQCAARGAHHA